jgi:hypothetical protein
LRRRHRAAGPSPLDSPVAVLSRIRHIVGTRSPPTRWTSSRCRQAETRSPVRGHSPRLASSNQRPIRRRSIITAASSKCRSRAGDWRDPPALRRTARTSPAPPTARQLARRPRSSQPAHRSSRRSARRAVQLPLSRAARMYRDRKPRTPAPPGERGFEGARCRPPRRSRSRERGHVRTHRAACSRTRDVIGDRRVGLGD